MDSSEHIRSVDPAAMANGGRYEWESSVDQGTAEAMQDVRDQLRRTFEVAIESCTTLDELFKLKDLSVALNGLLGLAKESNG